MAKIKDILQGFVDINLNTDEKSFYTKIFYTDTITSTPKDYYIAPPISLNKILDSIGLDISNVIRADIQGSRLYGVNNAFSDWDFAIIVKDSFLATYNLEYAFFERTINGENLDIHVYSESAFIQNITNSKMRQIEVLFHPSRVVLFERKKLNLQINYRKLANRVILESDELFNQAARKIKINKKYEYISKKNIWHSIRFLLFALQIIKKDSIVNFSEANYLYNEIMNEKSNDIEFFNQKYSPLINSLKQELTRYAQS